MNNLESFSNVEQETEFSDLLHLQIYMVPSYIPPTTIDVRSGEVT